MTTEESTIAAPQWARIHFIRSTVRGRPAYAAEILHPNPNEPEFICQDHPRTRPHPTKREARADLMGSIRPQHLAGQFIDSHTVTTEA